MNQKERDELLIRIDERSSRIEAVQADQTNQLKALAPRVASHATAIKYLKAVVFGSIAGVVALICAIVKAGGLDGLTKH